MTHTIDPNRQLKSLDLRPFQPSRGAAFAGALGASLMALQPEDFVPGAQPVESSEHQQLTEQTRNWVAQTFFGTLLKQMRNSPFKSDLFSGGRGGEAFGTLYDQQLADRMSQASGAKLVASIVRQLEAKKAYQKQNPTSREQPALPREDSNPFKDVRIHVAPALRG